MKYMDRLPTVISCCFCCFLRAGTVMIAVFSFHLVQYKCLYDAVSRDVSHDLLTNNIFGLILCTLFIVHDVLDIHTKNIKIISLKYWYSAAAVAWVMLSGLLFAPNVTHTRGFWDMDPVLSYYSSATENTIQIVLGAVSIMLCFVSALLLIGACCNLPALIEIYQWGVAVYSSTVVLLFFILVIFCFFVHSNCVVAGAVLLVLMVVIVLLTMYFMIVVNSLRMSIKYLNDDVL